MNSVAHCLHNIKNIAERQQQYMVYKHGFMNMT